MKNLRLVVGLATLLSCAPAWSRACQLSAGDILTKVSETYRSLRSLRMVADREYSPQASARVSLVAVAPSKVRIEVTDAHRHLLFVSDDETLWAYDAKRKRYAKGPASTLRAATGPGQPVAAPTADTPGQLWNLLVGRYVRLADEASVASLDGQEKLKLGKEKVNCWRLRLTFKHGTLELWIQEGRFLVLRDKERHDVDLRVNGIIEPAWSQATVELKEIALNPSVDPSSFTFTPPKDAVEVNSLDLLGGPSDRQ